MPSSFRVASATALMLCPTNINTGIYIHPRRPVLVACTCTELYPINISLALRAATQQTTTAATAVYAHKGSKQHLVHHIAVRFSQVEGIGVYID